MCIYYYINYCLPLSSNVRFRWVESGVQGSVPLSWAVDNVYIGPACIYNCGGHGQCMNGDTCECDEGYEGVATCLPVTPHNQSVAITFDGELLVK